MRVLIVGMGSIGIRHQRVLQALGHDVCTLSRHQNVSDRNEHDLTKALDIFEPEYIVIANKTSEHFSTLEKILSLGFKAPILVEKPLFEGNRILGHPKNVFVGYNLRFHPLLESIHKTFGRSDVLHASAYVGQHLSLWRKGVNHLESYSSHKNQGGGVLRDLSHEIDYLNWLIGPFRRVLGTVEKIGDVTIDSEDCVQALLESVHGARATIQLNCLDFVQQRRLTVTTKQQTAVADFITGEVQTQNGRERFSVERDDTYRAMHSNILSGKETKACSYADGVVVLKIIEAIDLSAKKKSWIELGG